MHDNLTIHSELPVLSGHTFVGGGVEKGVKIWLDNIDSFGMFVANSDTNLHV